MTVVVVGGGIAGLAAALRVRARRPDASIVLLEAGPRLGLARWQVAYQSRSGDPRDPWLEPDVNDALRALAAGGARDVVVAPIGFVVDHVEVLYDLDVQARETAASLGLGFARAATVGDHPTFVATLADVVREAAA